MTRPPKLAYLGALSQFAMGVISFGLVLWYLSPAWESREGTASIYEEQSCGADRLWRVAWRALGSYDPGETNEGRWPMNRMTPGTARIHGLCVTLSYVLPAFVVSLAFTHVVAWMRCGTFCRVCRRRLRHLQKCECPYCGTAL